MAAALFGVGIAAVEHPLLSAYDDFSQASFGSRVVERQAPVGEHSAELLLLIDGIAERLRRERATLLSQSRLLHPVEEGIDERPHVLVAGELTLGRRQLSERVIGRVDGANAQQPLQAHLILTDGGLEEIAAAMGPTSDQLDDVVGLVLRRTAIEDVVDAARIGLQGA